MTDLLARLRSPPMVKTSHEMTPAKIECLDHMYSGGRLTMTRARGDDLPKPWEIINELVDTGHATAHPVRIQDGIRTYEFSITEKGRAEVRSRGRYTGTSD